MNLAGLIVSISTEYPLFRQPRKIGDVFESIGETFIVLGIEKFEVFTQSIKVWYTCQNLNRTDYISAKKTYKDNLYLEMYAKIKFDDERLKTRFFLGSLQMVKGQFYKLMEYTDIHFDGTDLRISFTGKPIYPLDKKEAKSKRLGNKKKKLKLEVF